MPTALFVFIALFSSGVLSLILYEEMKYRRLLEVEQDRNAMVAILSHRLRTPLTAMKWYTEMLVNGDFGKSRLSQIEALHRLDDGAQSAIELVERFLGFSRAELDQISSNPVAIDIRETIDHVLDSLKERIRIRGVHIQFKRGVVRRVAYVDPMLLHAVLDTLLSNASLYTPESGTVFIVITDSNNEITIEVRDTGIGIPLEDQNKIFKPFYRSEEAKKVYPGGTGLGLSLTKKLIQKAGGSIRFKSTYGDGTSFFVTLPASPNQ